MTDSFAICLKIETVMRQYFLFYQQCLCVTQKLQLQPVQLLIPAVFILQLSQLSFAQLWRKAARLIWISISFQTTHASLEGYGIFLFTLLPLGLMHGI